MWRVQPSALRIRKKPLSDRLTLHDCVIRAVAIKPCKKINVFVVGTPVTGTTGPDGRYTILSAPTGIFSIDALCEALSNVVSGRLACPPEISGGLLRALFRVDSRSMGPDFDHGLTRRECEVLQLVGRGLFDVFPGNRAA
jgi:hypothetical protein